MTQRQDCLEIYDLSEKFWNNVFTNNENLETINAVKQCTRAAMPVTFDEDVKMCYKFFLINVLFWFKGSELSSPSFNTKQSLRGCIGIFTSQQISRSPPA